MPWVRLDDGFYEHPKVASLRDRAFRVHVAGLCYCSKNLTDGFVSDKAIKVMAVQLEFPLIRHITELAAANLWQKTDDGYVINDFLEYNPDAATVKRRRAERSAAGKRGADSRWHNNSDNNSDNDSHGDGHMPPAPVPSPTRLKAVPADQEIEHEIDKILRAVNGSDQGTRGVLTALAAKLPLSSVAKVRESCQSRKVGPGYAVNALRAELAEIGERNEAQA